VLYVCGFCLGAIFGIQLGVVRKYIHFGFLLMLVPVTITLLTRGADYLSSRPSRTDDDLSEPQVLGFPNGRDILVTENGEYAYAFARVRGELELSLIPNFSERLSAAEARVAHSCSTLVNAGFYSEDKEPIGLFITDGREVSRWQQNRTFNGIFSVNAIGTPRITRGVPGDVLSLAVQTGPILKENGQYLSTRMERDKSARRVVAGVTGENEAVFAVFYKERSSFSGPTLEELPEVLSEFELRSGVALADAINLDGGSASAFVADDTMLSELSPVGSFFCIR